MSAPKPAPDGRSDGSSDELPGEFLSDELRSDTERFLDDVKRLVQRRRAIERDGADPELGSLPPRE